MIRRGPDPMALIHWSHGLYHPSPKDLELYADIRYLDL